MFRAPSESPKAAQISKVVPSRGNNYSPLGEEPMMAVQRRMMEKRNQDKIYQSYDRKQQ